MMLVISMSISQVLISGVFMFGFCFKQKTAYEMRISDWSSDVCSSDLQQFARSLDRGQAAPGHHPPANRGKQAQCGRGDDPKRTFRSDQQLLEVEAAVVDRKSVV